ncbi:MAG TPA: NADH-quinone oxidoreductase subunit K [Marinagarivorans sp.]
MSSTQFFAFVGVALVCIAMHSLIARAHLLRKILAINIMSSGVFLFLVALAWREQTDLPPDPICHAMVLTGIVVAVSATAFALGLLIKFNTLTGATQLNDAQQ